MNALAGSYQGKNSFLFAQKNFWLHKLAQHMNHGPAFQALWRQLRVEVRALQDKGYYGDGTRSSVPRKRPSQTLSGYWSSGQRLTDSARVAGEGIEPGDLPEYMVRCASVVSRSINDNVYSAVVHKHARDPRLSAVSEEKGNQQARRPRNAKQVPA